MAYIRSEFEVGDTSLNVLVVGVVEMTIDDLLGEGEGSVESDYQWCTKNVTMVMGVERVGYVGTLEVSSLLVDLVEWG